MKIKSVVVWKRLMILMAIVSIVTVSFFFYHIYFGSSARTGQKNIENVRNIERGMDSSEVVSVMGKPFDIWYLRSKPERIFVYTTPPLYSETIQILFDSSGHVIEFGPTYEWD